LGQTHGNLFWSGSGARAFLPAAAAIGLCGWLGAPAARGSFDLSWNQGTSSNGYTVWTLTSQDVNGIGPAGPFNPDTGTGIISLDLTVSTPGSFNSTVGAMLIDLNTDIDGDGQLDANVSGQPDQNGVSPTLTFGSALGTFIGYNSSIPSSTKTNTIPYLTNSVWVNDQTYANYTPPVFGGGTISLAGTPAIYETTQTADELTSEIDPAFLNGTVHSLEVGILAPQNQTTARPIANIVVPNNTPITAIAILQPIANTGITETYTISTAPLQPMPEVSLSASAIYSPVGTISLMGGNGFYRATAIPLLRGKQVTGSLQVNGFHPAGDKEIFVLAIDFGGDPLTSDELTDLIPDIQSRLTPTNAVVQSFDSLPMSIRSLYAPDEVFNVAITFPNGDAAAGGMPDSPVFFNYDLLNSGYSYLDDLSITDIGVVPEPGSVAVLAVGGIGLMWRLRRIRNVG
jgi:hypothetical protein